MNLADTIRCTFGGGGGDASSSTAPVGQHPEKDGTWYRKRKGGKDKGGVQAVKVDQDTAEFIQQTKPALLGRKQNARKVKRQASLRGTSGGQSEGSSKIARKFYVVDGQGRVLHTYRTREEANQASAGNRYTKVVTHVQDATPLEDTPEVRDMIRKRPADTQNYTFKRSVPFPGSLGGIYPGSGQSR